MTLRLICILVSLLGGTVAGDGCVFHEYLTNGQAWYTKNGMATTTYRFMASYMNETTYGPLGELEVSRVCLASYGNDKYLLTWKEDEEVVYQCTELQIVSRNVAILRYAELESDEEVAASGCEVADIPMVYSDKPLWNLKKHAITENLCGLEGGFEFYVEVNENLDYCKNSDKSMKPTLEVGCSSHPGLHFNFQNNFNCRGYLPFSLEQTLTCLGTWERGSYRFTIITDGEYLLPITLLMRFPKMASSDYTLSVFPDIKMDMTPVPAPRLKPYINNLVMKKKDYPTVCENEASKTNCEKVCHNNDDEPTDMKSVYCMKTCDTCPHEQGDCNFMADIKGDWKVMGEETRHVVVTSSLLYVDGMVPLKCLNLSGNSMDMYAQPVYSVFSNGCKPKYACAYIRARGPNIIQYTLSEKVSWPYREDLTDSDICNYIWPSELKLAMKEAGKQAVDCGIRGSFSFNSHSFRKSHDKTCSGIIKSCNFKDVFRVSFSNECTEPSSNYQCIASYTEGSSKFIITQMEDDSQQKQCWVVHTFEEDDHSTMYLMPPEHCGSIEVASSVRSGLLEYQKVFNISSSIELNNEVSCNRVPKSTTTTIKSEVTSSRTPSVSTTKMNLITQNIPPNKPTSEKPYSVDDFEPRARTGTGPITSPNILFLIYILTVLLFLQ